MNPWMIAHESLTNAQGIIEKILSPANFHKLTKNAQVSTSIWRRDIHLLNVATPFAWGTASTDAVLEASKSVPGDTMLSGWNLPVEAAWWHFERELPVPTLDVLPSGVRAINMGWMGDHFVINCWVDDDRVFTGVSIVPSQVWSWHRGETLDEMIARCRQEHAELYGPGGKFEECTAFGIDSFVEASHKLSAFILAGLAWMSQKILVQSDGPIERHRRKDFVRTKGREPRPVKVIQLRKTEHRQEAVEVEGEKRDWACRWLVGGHWRNQACGPKRGDRKLTFISPYIKGPDDKPFKAPVATVYEVNR